MSPFREPPAAPPAEAPSRDGRVRLEIGPQHVRLELGDRWRLSVADAGAVWVRRGRRGRGDRRRELPLGRARLWVARAHPTRELAVWYEVEPGVVQRLGGVRPVTMSDPDPLAAWRALDRLAADLAAALAPWSGGVVEATELGRGHERVLLLSLGERLVAYARPLFRDRQRRALELGADGTLVVPARRGDRRGQVQSRVGVSVEGNRIAFADVEDRPVASLWVPGLAVEDREELARRFSELVEPWPPEPDSSPWKGPLRPWASGLGRPPIIASRLSGPSAVRFRR